MEKRSINDKLLEFQTSIETIKKDGKNTFFKKQNGQASTYATLPNILAEVKPILNALKLVLTQPITNNEVKTIITCSESGEKIESGIPLPTNLNAQQAGSAITYFRRYTLSSLLALEIDEDDDGNKASIPEKKDDDQRPWLSEKQLQKACDRIKQGEEGVYENIDKAFRMKKEYRETLKKLFA